MLKFKKSILLFDDGIKDRLDFILKFSNKKAKFKNGKIISIDKTNLYYVEPHRMQIGKHSFLFFNYENEVYYENLNNKIELKNLKEFIENLD